MTNKGQEKSHTITRTNPETASTEERQVTQAEWREQGKQLKAEGWSRVDEIEDIEGTTTDESGA